MVAMVKHQNQLFATEWNGTERNDTERMYANKMSSENECEISTEQVFVVSRAY